VLRVEDVPSSFHARFSAEAKRYRYLMRHAGQGSPFERRYVWGVPEVLDTESMRAEAAAVLGEHDFAAFQSAGTKVSGTIRTIRRSELLTTAAGVHPAAAGELLAYEVSGDGFLRHMVRALVGTIVDVGRGRRPAGTMVKLLASRRRADAGPTAPAHGLFLVGVDYD
jgi:tRNA pseudouridine38-40 synthase